MPARRCLSGIKDAGRLVHTLTPMSEVEAKKFGIPEADRHSHVQLDPVKVNIAAGEVVQGRRRQPRGGSPNGDEAQTARYGRRPTPGPTPRRRC
jgi:hypothetical protein